MRNVLIAAGNANDEVLIQSIKPHLSSDLPLVRSMAVWALGCYLSKEQMKTLYREDCDRIVEDEWKRALNH